VDQLLLERLALAVGQKIAIGNAQFDIAGHDRRLNPTGFRTARSSARA
jgi:predicted lysophospholipase L1 biosynthesis ABC-type transport system permease subunit